MQLPLTETHFVGPAPVPAWLPDETLFSWASRYHAISGNRVSSHTCLALFGHPLQGAQHDFPSRIEHLVAITTGLLGDSQSIAFDRTILPFYLHFIGKARADSALCALKGKKVQGLRFQLGLVTSRFRANHPLKACPQCIAKDQDTYGTAYWHLSHQYPGVWVCAIHQHILLESTLKSTGVGRFLWHLPSHQSLRSSALIAHDNLEPAIAPLGAFAEISMALAKLPHGSQFESSRLHQVYKTALLNRGLTTQSQRLLLRKACKDYREAIRPLASVTELTELYGTDATIDGTLGKLLRRPRSGTHPLRHIALIYWLFGSWQAFINSYDSWQPSTENDDYQQEKRPDPNSKARADFCACIDSGLSVTHCSKQVGITTSTGIAWASAHGLKVKRRPKTISDNVLEALIASLRTGADKISLMEQHSLSAATINRILGSVEGLHGQWSAVRFQKLQSANQSIWLSAIAENPSCGLKVLRAKHPAAYAWLYRNDLQWLKRSIEGLPKATQRTRRSSVDWTARDLDLAEKVRLVASALLAERANTALPRRAIARWEIIQLFPELRAKLAVLKKLPLTKQAISVAIQGSPQADLFKD